MYASDMCNNLYVRHKLCDAHDRRITINKIEETYAKPVKTGQSDLTNRTIRFCQAKPIKLEHLVYKTRTSDFSRLSILIRKQSSLYLRHSKIRICIKLT
jgi:hypothetical protein